MMRKFGRRQWVEIILVGLSLVMASAWPASAAETRYRMVEKSGEYLITTGGGRLLPLFTSDEDGNLPENLAVAQARFARRKDRIERWYAKWEPDLLGNYRQHELRDLAMIPVEILLIPVDFVRSITPKPKTKKKVRREVEYISIEAFIAEDCRQEFAHKWKDAGESGR